MANVKKSKSLSFSHKFQTIVFGWAASFFGVCTVLLLFQFLLPESGWKLVKGVQDYKIILYACIVAPLVEELVFRHAPLQLLKQTKDYKKKEFFLVVITSVLFAMIHGNFGNVYVQGVGGFVFSYVYIKNGYSYISAVITHSLYNLTLMFILPHLIPQVVTNSIF